MADALDRLGGLKAARSREYYIWKCSDRRTSDFMLALIARIEAQEAKIAQLEQELADERLVFESNNELIGKLQADLEAIVKASEYPPACPHGEEVWYCDSCNAFIES